MQCAIDEMPASVEFIKPVAISLWLLFSASQHFVAFAGTLSGKCRVYSS